MLDERFIKGGASIHYSKKSSPPKSDALKASRRYVGQVALEPTPRTRMRSPTPCWPLARFRSVSKMPCRNGSGDSAIRRTGLCVK